ncbi:hypothetical protein K435DRAFT_618061, partial [Dendrothele bispora CBS 962.96]
LATKIHWSQSLQWALEAVCRKEKIKYKTIKRLVKTRWNSFTVMLGSLLYLRKALDRLCANDSNLPVLLNSDWVLIESLYGVLKPFIWFTEEFQNNKRPLIHEVLPLMDTISHQLDDFKDNLDEHDLVRAAVERGIKILDKYYSKTDDSVVY